MSQLTPLHFACKEGHLDVVQHLIRKGAQIDAKTQKNWTPLNQACFNGHLEVIEYLIQEGAQLGPTASEDASDFYGWKYSTDQ